jgi:hypothetical protein
MNEDRRFKCPGEVWWTYHPWLSRVEFWDKGGSKMTTRTLRHDMPSHVHIPCKPHPALILAPGDENNLGYLVCYFSSHSKSDDEIQRRKLNGVKITDDKDTFLFSMAPCYCLDEFIWGREPMKILDDNALELIKGVLKRACRLQASQNWTCFDFHDLKAEFALDKVEEVRRWVRELMDAIRISAPPVFSTDPDKMPSKQSDFESDLDSALGVR